MAGVKSCPLLTDSHIFLPDCPINKTFPMKCHTLKTANRVVFYL